MTLYRDATVDEIEQGYLEPTYVVPVEPCEHGNTGHHIVDNDRCTVQDAYGDVVHDWCDGGEPA